ncbi:MAG: glucosyl transferase [Ignavibacteriaceae bacterium]|nr:glucosyl transferase [Ignavibacteriaceae bacterium]
MYKLYFFFFLLLISIISCKTTEPTHPGPDPKITLSVEDVSCTGAWLNLKLENVSLPANLTIQLNNNSLNQINLLTSDSTIFIDSLLPNKNYSFKASIFQNNKSYSSENIATVTMDTTSHNFTWQKLEFGDYTSNILFDVAIIDENNIWAGGEIYLIDSTGQRDPTHYNAVHWDGLKWEVLRIPTRRVTGDITSAPIRAIYAFNKDDIWTFSDAGSYSHWDGKVWKTEYINLINGSGYKFWGTNSSDLYLGLYRGQILHYDGLNWANINTGTDLNINDIYGSWNNKTNQYDIMLVASNVLESFDRQILKISGQSVSKLNNNPIAYTLSSIWFKPNRKYYVVGAGIYEKNNLNEDNWKNNISDITTYYTYSIRGNDLNDIFVIGGFGEVLHFNGMNWKSFMSATRIEGNLYSVCIKNNLVIAVGYGSTKGIIFIGKR